MRIANRASAFAMIGLAAALGGVALLASRHGEPAARPEPEAQVLDFLIAHSEHGELVPCG